MNNWTNDEKINKMIAEIIELRLRIFARSTGMYDGVCPHGLTYANDEMCVPFDECSECKKYLIEEQRKKIEKEVLEEYKIEYKEDNNA